MMINVFLTLSTLMYLLGVRVPFVQKVGVIHASTSLNKAIKRRQYTAAVY
jgi:hypothetical protein